MELADELGLPSVEDALKFPKGTSASTSARRLDISALHAFITALVVVVTCFSIGSMQ